jgi:hypothetical protein
LIIKIESETMSDVPQYHRIHGKYRRMRPLHICLPNQFLTLRQCSLFFDRFPLLVVALYRGDLDEQGKKHCPARAPVASE